MAKCKCSWCGREYERGFLGSWDYCSAKCEHEAHSANPHLKESENKWGCLRFILILIIIAILIFAIFM